MTEPIQISAATYNDIAAIEILVNSAYRGDSSRAGWTTEADLLDGIRIDKERIEQMLEAPGSTILKATDANGEVIGVVHLEKKGSAMYLGMLTVKPTLQGSGIGRQLMTAGEALAKEKGCTKMEMTVISVRHELINWYKSKGYAETGDKKPFPTDPRFGLPRQPLEFIVLEKSIT